MTEKDGVSFSNLNKQKYNFMGEEDGDQEAEDQYKTMMISIIKFQI